MSGGSPKRRELRDLRLFRKNSRTILFLFSDSRQCALYYNDRSQVWFIRRYLLEMGSDKIFGLKKGHKINHMLYCCVCRRYTLYYLQSCFVKYDHGTKNFLLFCIKKKIIQNWASLKCFMSTQFFSQIFKIIIAGT